MNNELKMNNELDAFEIAELADFYAGEVSCEDNRELPVLEDWERDLEPF